METVEVPASVLLETMLKSLGLASPRYEHISAGGAHFETKVLFYPSMEFIQSSAKPHSLSSFPEDNLEEATNIAAIRAIKYMKTKENKVLKYFSYEELQREKKVSRALVRQMEAKDLKSYKRTRQLRETADAYDNYMDAIRDATRRIQKLVSDHGKRGTVLLDIKAVADDLAQLTSQSNTQLNVGSHLNLTMLKMCCPLVTMSLMMNTLSTGTASIMTMIQMGVLHIMMSNHRHLHRNR